MPRSPQILLAISRSSSLFGIICYSLFGITLYTQIIRITKSEYLITTSFFLANISNSINDNWLTLFFFGLDAIFYFQSVKKVAKKKIPVRF